MNFELLNSVLMVCSWIFLGGWTVFLLLASLAVFRNDFS